jgi:hypothetical protein
VHLGPHVAEDADPVQPRRERLRRDAAAADAVQVDVAAGDDRLGETAEEGQVDRLGGLLHAPHRAGEEGAPHVLRGVVRPEGAADVRGAGRQGGGPADVGRDAHPQRDVARVADLAAEPGDRRGRGACPFGELVDRQVEHEAGIVQDDLRDPQRGRGEVGPAGADPVLHGGRRGVVDDPVVLWIRSGHENPFR